MIMDILVYIILASLIVSLVSFSGVFLFVFNQKKLQKYMILFVAFAAGILLGTTFLHLIPESVELYSQHELEAEEHELESGLENIDGEAIDDEEHSHMYWPSYFILFGILLFYIIEKFIHWHHHHDIDCHKHPVTTLSLIGDGFHNFLDGIVIGVAFLADIRLGIVTTIAIALHEIPQEIGEMSVLLHGGFSRFQALFWNFVSALFSVFGAVIGYLFMGLESYIPLILSFTAGMFIYISLADIVPELHKKHEISRGIIGVVFFVGILISFLATNLIIH